MEKDASEVHNCERGNKKNEENIENVSRRHRLNEREGILAMFTKCRRAAASSRAGGNLNNKTVDKFLARRHPTAHNAQTRLLCIQNVVYLL